MANTVSWARKPHTQQERIEAWLGEGNLHDQLAAKEALERQGAEADALLRALIHRDARSYREGKRQLCIGLLLIGCVAVVLFCRQVSQPGSAAHIALFLLLAFWLFFPCTLSWYEDFRTYGRRLHNAVTLLHRMPPSASTAEMIEAMDAGDERTAALAARTLIQLLPHLTEAEGARLQAHHHRALRRALRGCNTELILTILQASARILNHTAMPDVRWLTKCPDWIAESEKIQAEAHQALLSLEANSRRRRTVQTLLRPAALSDHPAEELLRPATSISTIPVNQMLRAGNVPPASVSAEHRY